ncbi:hypothetical protein Godav_009080 [Gossypium davidsonii]|uniref:Uncharacterized protein n=1 Tax=Gossypium davidsonii TaxID=34287 RepID=A0A7J8SC32_GOSDV|nr:hypothetical protein [Gossypium davidsonii]
MTPPFSTCVVLQPGSTSLTSYSKKTSLGISQPLPYERKQPRWGLKSTLYRPHSIMLLLHHRNHRTLLEFSVNLI